MDYYPFWLSFKLAFLTSFLLLIAVQPIVFFLSIYKNKFSSFIEVLANIPLALPPSVLGFYILILFKPSGFVGGFYHQLFNSDLAFSFEGILFASLLFNFPFMLNPLVVGIQNMRKEYFWTAYSLGYSKLKTYHKIVLPNMFRSIVAAFALTFAHTVGEFGLVLMVGGSIPGKTQVASIALFNKVELMKYAEAHQYAVVLLSLSLAAMFVIKWASPKNNTIC